MLWSTKNKIVEIQFIIKLTVSFLVSINVFDKNFHNYNKMMFIFKTMPTMPYFSSFFINLVSFLYTYRPTGKVGKNL